VSSFISTDGPFGGGNIFGNIFSPTGGIVIPTIPGVGQILGQIPGQIIGQIPGLGQINQAIGTYNIVNDVYKNVMGSDITSVTQISSLVTDFGSAISSQLASIGSAIGSLFGFGGGGSYIDL
jgi:predicted PurR-regulated permease PerM